MGAYPEQDPVTVSDVRANITVSGRVQGVFFRASARDEALSLGINGWVKNKYNGDVEALAEGPRVKVEAFVEWCRHGPSFAKVDNIRIEWSDPTGEFAKFSIRY